MKTGYSIRTWRMRLVCPEPIWLDRTEEYFQNVVEFYYHLLRQHEELWNSSLFDIQRSLELLSLAGRDGRQPTNPLPMGKVPVYLRPRSFNPDSLRSWKPRLPFSKECIPTSPTDPFV